MPYKKNDAEKLLSANSEKVSEFADNDMADELYIPSKQLIDHINLYFNSESDTSGQLLEEIAALMVSCIKGFDKKRIKSFRSTNVQIDIEVSGNSQSWYWVMEYLHLPKEGRTIIIEAKDINKSINNTNFVRLCWILEHKYSSTSHLGIFIAPKGASGFPTPTRKRTCLSEAFATQALFHARTKKFVIVLDDRNLKELATGANLLEIIEKKIQEIESGTGLYDNFLSPKISKKDSPLPPHIQKYFK